MATLRRSARLSSSAARLEPSVPEESPATVTKKKATVTKAVAATKASAAAASAKEATPKQPRKRKSEATLAAPAKPEDKRRRGRASTPPPPPPGKTTTTPVVPSTPVSKPRHAGVARLADPESTNAPLLSPETSRIIAPKSVEDLTLSQAPKARITTDNILKTALAHLVAVDARMKPLIKAHHCHVFSPAGLAEKVDPFEALASSIISQQVSGAAARSIKAKFVGLYHSKEDSGVEKEHQESQTSKSSPSFPHPSEVAATSIETLRTAGLSQRKAEYIQGLAEKFASGELTAQLLADAPYETLVEKLVAVRGLGLWSVEMFAMFGLKRMDVFSTGDLGVQRGMAAFVGRDVAKLKAKGGLAGQNKKWKYMTGDEMELLAEPFKPYRSVFMWYMWRVEQTDVSTMEIGK